MSGSRPPTLSGSPARDGRVELQPRKRPPRSGSPHRTSPTDGGTPPELEIVRHAAAGLTNPEIGERMFISRGTVKIHLSHVDAKLGLRNRSEVAAEAMRRQPPGHI